MRWEYIMGVLSMDATRAERELNTLGAGGWELVQILQQRRDAVAVFKREVSR